MSTSLDASKKTDAPTRRQLIDRDFATARLNKKNTDNSCEFVVTPQLPAVRMPQAAHVRANIYTTNSAKARSLINAYKQQCPSDARVEFFEEPMTCSLRDKVQHVIVLRVRVTFS